MREPPARGLEMIRVVVTQGHTDVKFHGAVGPQQISLVG